METEIKLTGAVLCALSENTSDDGLDASLDELERLLDTAGGQCGAVPRQAGRTDVFRQGQD